MTNVWGWCAAAVLAAMVLFSAAPAVAQNPGGGAASAPAVSTPDAPAVEPIKTLEIGKNRQFIVNGKPFFPIMSWAQSAKNFARITKAAGFNTHCGGGDPNAAAAVGCYSVIGFKEAWAKDPYLLGWIHGDEPDMDRLKEPNNRSAGYRPKTPPEDVLANYQKIKEADKLHPVFVTFTGNFTSMDSKYDAATRAKIYPAFVKAADVVGFDIYPIYGSGHASHLDWVAKGVSELRELGGPRPLYAWIETSKGSKWMTAEKQPPVLPMHTRAEVWMAIIRGATAIGYFTHAWRPPPETSFAPLPEMQAEMKRLNAQITRLSAAILADPAAAKIEMKLAGEGADLHCHFKATQLDGATYIFAQNIDLGEGAEALKQFDPITPRAGKATITVPGLKAGAKIEVVDEGRALTADDGKFTDDFAPLAEHVNRIPNK